MAAARRQAFVEKVLKRLFPQDPHGREKGAPSPAACEAPPQKERCRHAPPLAGGGTGTPPGRRLYTAALPPEGYVPAPAPAPAQPEPEPEPEAPSCVDSADSEGSSSSQDAEDQEPRDQPKRRRIRKHRSKTKPSRPSGVPVEEAQAEGQRSLRPQPRPTDGPAISKNRKRKLKKKQQVKRRRAAGLPTKAAGLSFLYVPGGGDSEPGDSSEGAGGGGSGAEAPGGAGGQEDRGDGVDQEDRGDHVDQEDRGAGVDQQDPGDGVDQEDRGDRVDPEDPGDRVDTEQDGGKGLDHLAEGVLDFLRSTQEMYFYDGVSRGADPAFLAASEALLRDLAAGSVPPSDLQALGHMKALLLLLRDPGALRGALQAFEEHCALPPDQARVVSAFFSYWLTHILPEQPGSPPTQEA